jgi:hypothetical protein
MAYMYESQPIAIFDITRAAAEHSDHIYTMAEKLKNAWHQSTKYEPVMKLFKPPNVIVFANMCPQHDKWTAGRVEQIDMEGEKKG